MRFSAIFNKISDSAAQLDHGFGRKLEAIRFDAAVYVKKKRYFLAYLFAVAILAFAYELFNFTLSIDEEIHANLEGPSEIWLRQGRWMIYLLNAALFPVSIVPVIPTLVAVLFSAFAYLITLRILSPRNTFAEYLAAPLFIACPILYYQYSFSMQSYALGVGFFLASAAVLVFISSQGPRRLWAIALMVPSIAIYQSFPVWLAVLFLLYLLSLMLRRSGKNAAFYLAECARFSALLLVSLLLYGAIEEALLKVFVLERSSYIESFIKLRWDKDFFFSAAAAVKRRMIDYYFGSGKIYGAPLQALAGTFLLSLALTIFSLFRSRQGFSVILTGFFFLSAALALPFSFTLLGTYNMPVRVHTPLVLVFSSLFLFAYAVPNKLSRLLLAGLALGCAFQFIVLNQRLAFSSHLSWQADRELAVRVQQAIDRIPKLPPPVPKEKRPLVIVGRHQRPSSPVMISNQTIGGSFFTWDGGRAERVVFFMKTMGLSHYRPAVLRERVAVLDMASQMPPWPHKDSVKALGNIIIVKFSDYPVSELRGLCRNSAGTASVCKTLPEFQNR